MTAQQPPPFPRTEAQYRARPRLLDLFCGAGGAAMGYHRAGFDVVGVDINPQPDYPFEFVLADALEVLAVHLPKWQMDEQRFDAIHASPPCQGYSIGALNSGSAKALAPRLIRDVREQLQRTSVPWVIENVNGARTDMRETPEGYFVLCGTMFSDDMPRRHRLFEARPFLWPPVHPKCVGHNKRLAARLGVDRRSVEVASVHSEDYLLWRDLMGMPWADAAGLSLAIPPAYTEWIGTQLLRAIEAAA